ncbi:protein phosphatase 2C domain-containing protein [bacterium]|nr:protein phosphatase 2C domain-containing protein [bacterium]
MARARAKAGWLVCAHSQQGAARALNQDRYHADPPHFFGVADGVGGGALGEVASELLLQQLAPLRPQDAPTVARALAAADQLINARIAPQGLGPGAAVVACLWGDPAAPQRWLGMTVGDCKLIHARQTQGVWHLLWQSTDQSYAATGLTAPPGVSAQAPANMVGCGLSLPTALQPLQTRSGDRLILCSDGFFGALQAAGVQHLLQDTPCPLPSDAAQRWCEAARQRGSQDDITVLIVESAAPGGVARWPWLALALALALCAGVAAWVWWP